MGVKVNPHEEHSIYGVSLNGDIKIFSNPVITKEKRLKGTIVGSRGKRI